MRKFTLKAIFLMALLFVGFQLTGRGQDFYDGFTGTGDISNNNGWTIHNGTGIIPINSGSLVYTGLQAPVGNRVTIPGNNTTVSADVNAPLTVGVVDAAYYSILINVIDNTQIKANPDYFMSFGATSGAAVTILGARLGIKSVNTGANYRLCIGNTSGGTLTYTDFAQDLDFGTTYLVVVKYDRSVSPTVAYLWVNPTSLGGSEPTGFVSCNTGTSAFSTFASICIRNSSNTPKADIDEIRVGTTWAQVTPTGTVHYVATPVITPPAGVYTTPQTITMTCDTAGATIYYTTDGQTPDDGSDVYDPNNKPQVSVTTTVKAIAYKDGLEPSSVATNLYRFPVDVATIAELKAGATDGTVYHLTGEALVTFTRPSSGYNQKYIQDATGAIVIHDVSGVITTPYVIGDGMTGITGTLTLYNGLFELIPVFDPGAPSSTGNPVIPEAKTISTITAADQSKLVSLNALSFPDTSSVFYSGKNYTVTNGGESIIFRTNFSEADYIGTAVPVTPTNTVAIVGQYNTTMQITPRFLTDMTAVPAPAITINPTTLTGFTYDLGAGPSTSQPFQVSASNLTPAAGDITVTGYTDYEVSSDNVTFGPTATFPYTGGTLAEVTAYVRMKAGLDGGEHADTVGVTGGGAAKRLLNCSGTVILPPAVYAWIGADGGDWATPGNWNPTRTNPLPNDILSFNDGTTKTVTGVITQTVGRLLVFNNTTVALQNPANATLTIAGGALGAGDIDLNVSSGSTLNLNGSLPLDLILATGAIGQISGNIALFSDVDTTAHRLAANDAGSLVFGNGSTFTAGTNFKGNPFGTTKLNSVVFEAGSTLIQASGSNPFGAGQPNSVVVFQTGSLYKITANLTPAFSGRTYANFELDAPGVNVSPSGSNKVTIDNLTLTNGNLNFNMTGTPGHVIKGNIHVAAGDSLRFNPSAVGTVTLNGTALQTISGEGIITGNDKSTIEVNNPAGVALTNNVQVTGSLKLTHGLITLGAQNLTLGAAATITGNAADTAMIVATGTGQVIKGFAATGSFTFPVGSVTEYGKTLIPVYTPATVNFTAGTFTDGTVGVNLKDTKYPPDPNNLNYIKRYWNLTPTGITDFTADLMFQYVPEDVNGHEENIYCVKVDVTPFVAYNAADINLHQLSATGIQTLGSFAGTVVVPENLDLGTMTIGSGVTTCFDARQTITVAGDDRQFVIQEGGSVTMIAGQNILLLPGTRVEEGGYLLAYITESMTFCGAKAPAVVAGTVKEIPVTTLQSERSAFKIYPNPTSGSFTLDMTGADLNEKVTVEIYRMTGEPVIKETLTGEPYHRFNLDNQPVGIYILRVLNSDMAGTTKIIKN